MITTYDSNLHSRKRWKILKTVFYRSKDGIRIREGFGVSIVTEITKSTLTLDEIESDDDECSVQCDLRNFVGKASSQAKIKLLSKYFWSTLQWKFKQLKWPLCSFLLKENNYGKKCRNRSLHTKTMFIFSTFLYLYLFSRLNIACFRQFSFWDYNTGHITLSSYK